MTRKGDSKVASQSGAHRRRTSSVGVHGQPKLLSRSLHPTVGGNPFNEEEEERKQMSLDHSPTRDGGGWSSPGLTTPYDEGSARSRGGSPGKKAYGDLMNGNSSHVTWAQAKAGSARVQRSNEGSFMRHMRKMSSGLPYFSDRSSYAEKEKLGRGRPWERVEWKDLPRRIGLLISRRRKYVALLVMMLLMILLFTNKSE